MTKTIKTVLFDLGKVVLPYDVNITYKAFEALGGQNVKAQFDSPAGQELYKKFEHNMPVEEFRTTVRSLLKLPAAVTDKQIDDAWCAMLLPIPRERIEQIIALRKSGKKTVVLSNSNGPHYDWIQKHYGAEFKQMFDEQNYSHAIKKAKPNADSYLHALNGRDPETVLFVDDKKENIVAASKLGIHAVEFTLARPISDIYGEIDKANAALAAKAQRLQTATYVRYGFGLFTALAAVGVGLLASGTVPSSGSSPKPPVG